MERIFKIHLIIIVFFISSSTLGQTIFEQDIIKGGVTAAGFSTGQGSGSGSFNIHIEPGSDVKKAVKFN
jgi:hypothetical protein